MISPHRLTSGPPELPGLIAASVCMNGVIQLNVESGTTRSIAEMIPRVAVLPIPRGYPTANTSSPIASVLELPNRALWRSMLVAVGFITARSEMGSTPTISAFAICSLPFETINSLAP